jgi:hypothetical protein
MSRSVWTAARSPPLFPRMGSATGPVAVFGDAPVKMFYQEMLNQMLKAEG